MAVFLGGHNRPAFPRTRLYWLYGLPLDRPPPSTTTPIRGRLPRFAADDLIGDGEPAEDHHDVDAAFRAPRTNAGLPGRNFQGQCFVFKGPAFSRDFGLSGGEWAWDPIGAAIVVE